MYAKTVKRLKSLMLKTQTMFSNIINDHSVVTDVYFCHDTYFTNNTQDDL